MSLMERGRRKHRSIDMAKFDKNWRKQAGGSGGKPEYHNGQKRTRHEEAHRIMTHWVYMSGMPYNQPPFYRASWRKTSNGHEDEEK